MSRAEAQWRSGAEIERDERDFNHEGHEDHEGGFGPERWDP